MMSSMHLLELMPFRLGDITGWCIGQDLYHTLRKLKHNDPDNVHCLPLYAVFVIGSDIKPEILAKGRSFTSISLRSGFSSMQCAQSSQDVVQLNGQGRQARIEIQIHCLSDFAKYLRDEAYAASKLNYSVIKLSAINLPDALTFQSRTSWRTRVAVLTIFIAPVERKW